MRFARRAHHERLLDVEITSMIDVVFLLIIFFMTTAQFARLTRAEVDLPKEKGEQTATPDEEGLVINILPDGVIIVSGETLTFDQLTTMVRREVARENAARGDATGLRLLLRADQHADTRMLNSIVRMIRQEGVGAARFGTEVPR